MLPQLWISVQFFGPLFCTKCSQSKVRQGMDWIEYMVWCREHQLFLLERRFCANSAWINAILFLYNTGSSIEWSNLLERYFVNKIEVEADR